MMLVNSRGGVGSVGDRDARLLADILPDYPCVGFKMPLPSCIVAGTLVLLITHCWEVLSCPR